MNTWNETNEDNKLDTLISMYKNYLRIYVNETNSKVRKNLKEIITEYILQIEILLDTTFSED